MEEALSREVVFDHRVGGLTPPQPWKPANLYATIGESGYCRDFVKKIEEKFGAQEKLLIFAVLILRD